MGVFVQPGKKKRERGLFFSMDQSKLICKDWEEDFSLLTIWGGSMDLKAYYRCGSC